MQQQQIDNIETKVDKIHEALCGNEYSDGLISRVEKTEKYQEKDKKLKWVGGGIIIAVSFLIKVWDKIT